jgi:hypothetical protein
MSLRRTMDTSKIIAWIITYIIVVSIVFNLITLFEKVC